MQIARGRALWVLEEGLTNEAQGVGWGQEQRPAALPAEGNRKCPQGLEVSLSPLHSLAPFSSIPANLPAPPTQTPRRLFTWGRSKELAALAQTREMCPVCPHTGCYCTLCREEGLPH